MLLQELLTDERERRKEAQLWSAVDLIRRCQPSICAEIAAANSEERESQIIDGKLLPAIQHWQDSSNKREKAAYQMLSRMRRLFHSEIDYTIPGIVR